MTAVVSLLKLIQPLSFYLTTDGRQAHISCQTTAQQLLCGCITADVRTRELAFRITTPILNDNFSYLTERLSLYKRKAILREKKLLLRKNKTLYGIRKAINVKEQSKEKGIYLMNGISPIIDLLNDFFSLEEQVAVVHYVSLHIKLVHEVTSILHRLLTALLFVCLLIKLNRTVSLVSNLEEVNTSITLNSMC